MNLQVGDQAPDFSLPNEVGELINLSKFQGQRVVIYFYPKDNTPGCTKEACNFRDTWKSFKANRIKVFGISKDGEKSHAKFIDKYSLPFTLLTDQEPCPVATAYESFGLKKFMGREYMGMIRNTFLINEQGKIERIYLKVKAEIMANQILEDLGIN